MAVTGYEIICGLTQRWKRATGNFVNSHLAGKSRVRSTVSLLEEVKKNESEGLSVEEILVE